MHFYSILTHIVFVYVDIALFDLKLYVLLKQSRKL